MVALKALLLSTLPLALAKSFVQDLTPDNFDSIVLQSGKPALVEFFAPWCGHCKNLAPVYEELGTAFSTSTDKVTIAKVDADAHKDLGRKFGVQGFPTLKWFDGKSDKPTDYESGRDLESLTAFVSEKSGVKAKVPKKKPSEVVFLTDGNFAETVGKERNVLVAFTAPWCGHCKALAPTWEDLASDFATEPNVVIAKVDAEHAGSKKTAEEYKVTSYPTIKWFPAGSSEPIDYEAGRSIADFVKWINEKAGTHRLAGGLLDETAGVIEALDGLVQEWVRAPAQEALKKVSTEAGKLKDAYAAYYAKVAGKTEKNEGYVTKELKRLEGIIKKGGLAPEKLDDLVSRSNILRSFQAKKEEEKSEL